METPLEHVYELEPHIKVGRARAAVLMFIVSDVLSVLAILAAGGYLNALNTEGKFRVAGDFGPSFVAGLVIAIGLVVSGLLYYLWVRKAGRPGETGQGLFFLLALLIMLAAGVVETWLGATLRYGIPISAYQSMLLLITWFTAVHLLFAAVIGLLLGGRILLGRMSGSEFLAEAAGYWWYYTIISSIALWLFSVLL